MRRIRLDVRPLPGEIFTSWLTRTAWTYGISPLDLTYCIWPKSRIWQSDIDRRIDFGSRQRLYQCIGFNSDLLDETFLANSATRVGSNTDDSIWSWFTNVGARNRRRVHGIQICPFCLMADRRKYLRKRWRFAWSFLCPEHACLLIDSCASCGAPVSPSFPRSPDFGFDRCWQCSKPFFLIEPRKVGSSDIENQRRFNFCYENGAAPVGDELAKAREWFPLVRHFINLLRKSLTVSETSSLSATMKSLNSKGWDLSEAIRPVPFELLPAKERLSLGSAALDIATIGISRFITAALDCGLSRQAFIGDAKRLSPLVSSIADALQKASYRRTVIRNTPKFYPSSIEQVVSKCETITKLYLASKPVSDDA